MVNRMGKIIAGAATLISAMLLAAVLAQSAAAHAQLLSSSPARDSAVKNSPASVELRFGEHVEAAFGAVRVFASDGSRVDTGPLIRPDGPSSVGVRLKPALADGGYTVTYRVTSADSHPVAGGFVFQVGTASTAPAKSVAAYLATEQAGQSTKIAYSVARFAGYLALCLLFGVAFFDAFVFGPAVARAGAAGAEAGFARGAGLLEGVGVALGVTAAATAIVFQGAVAGGQSFWSALDPDVVSEVVGTRSGTWMLVRLALWIAIAIVWALYARRGSRAGLASMLVLGALAAQTPALIGHAAVTTPVWLMVGLDFAHVVAMSLWVGGLVAALIALPMATRGVAQAKRTGLLVEVFGRFSQVALIAVGAIVVSGVGQAIVQIDDLSELTSTAYGRALLIKAALLLVVVAVAAINRFSILPGLRARLADHETPGNAGVALRRTLIGEVALTVVIIGVASALVGYAPAKAASSGPFVVNRTIGPAEMQLIVDPARSGSNQVHVYLTDPVSGAQYKRFKQLTIELSRDDPAFGPIALSPQVAGPGHYVAENAQFPGAGDWTLDVVMRVSEFDQYEQEFDLKIR
jgi:copper transport protein